MRTMRGIEAVRTQKRTETITKNKVVVTVQNQVRPGVERIFDFIQGMELFCDLRKHDGDRARAFRGLMDRAMRGVVSGAIPSFLRE